VAKPASVLPIMTTSSFAPADTLRRLTLAVALFAPLAAPAQASAPLQTIDRLDVGRAHQTGPADFPRREVRFARAWLSWLPMV
jgi:hypothetical protein